MTDHKKWKYLYFVKFTCKLFKKQKQHIGSSFIHVNFMLLFMSETVNSETVSRACKSFCSNTVKTFQSPKGHSSKHSWWAGACYIWVLSMYTGDAISNPSETKISATIIVLLLFYMAGDYWEGHRHDEGENRSCLSHIALPTCKVQQGPFQPLIPTANLHYLFRGDIGLSKEPSIIMIIVWRIWCQAPLWLVSWHNWVKHWQSQWCTIVLSIS